jgi:hypothetical protein
MIPVQYLLTVMGNLSELYFRCQDINTIPIIIIVKVLLGHSSVAVTQKSYAHFLESTLRTASEVMVKTLENALEKMPEVIPMAA